MIRPRWLASPLTATAGVLTGLGLLAIPLRQLTSAGPARAMPAAPAAAAAMETPAILRLRLLAPAKRLVLQTANGRSLIDARDVAAGESEHDAAVPLADGGFDLTLRADFGAAAGETAVFLTVMPDGYADQTRYAIGAGLIEETLRYEWRKH